MGARLLSNHVEFMFWTLKGTPLAEPATIKFQIS